MPVTQPLPDGPYTVGAGTPGQDAADIVAFLTQKGTATDAEILAAVAGRVAVWTASTAYAAGQSVVNPSGELVKALVAFTSGTTYSAANWSTPPSATYAPFSVTNARNPLTGWFHTKQFGAVGNGVADDTASVRACVNAAVAVGGRVYPDPGTYRITSTIAVNAPTLRTFVIETLPGTVIFQDECAASPCFSYTGAGGYNTIRLVGFQFKLAVSKPTSDIVQIISGQGSRLAIDCDVEGQGNVYTCRSAFYLKDCAEGKVGGRVVGLQGFASYLTCPLPAYNGGNIDFTELVSYANAGGVYIQGNVNNIRFGNAKFVGYQAFQLYLKLTSGVPVSGASTITIPAGIAAGYFRNNQAVILYSSAGMELVHMAAGGYNGTTGVLTLNDTVTLTHNAADLRIVTATSLGIVADGPFNVSLDGTHLEAVTSFLKDVPALATRNTIFSTACTSYTGTSVGCYVVGGGGDSADFRDSFFHNPTGVPANNSMVVILAPSGTSTPTINIAGVATTPANSADQSGTTRKPLDTPDAGAFFGFGNYAVNTNVTKGIQRTTQPAVAGAGTSGGSQGQARMFGGGFLPPADLGVNGDFFLRADTPGTANQRLYVRSAGAWVGIL